MTKKTGKPIGRPRHDLTEAMKARICREVGLGRSLRKLLKAKGMPSMTKVMTSLDEDAAFAKRYAHARTRGIELHIDGILDLADSANADNAAAVRLRVDTRKWLASKLVPKVYGDRVEVGGSVAVEVDPDELSRRERARRIAFLLKTAGDAIEQQEAARRLRLPAPSAPASPPRAEPEPPVQPHSGEREINPLPQSERRDSGPGHLNAAEQGLAEWQPRRSGDDA